MSPRPIEEARHFFTTSPCSCCGSWSHSKPSGMPSVRALCLYCLGHHGEPHPLKAQCLYSRPAYSSLAQPIAKAISTPSQHSEFIKRSTEVKKMQQRVVANRIWPGCSPDRGCCSAIKWLLCLQEVPGPILDISS